MVKLTFAAACLLLVTVLDCCLDCQGCSLKPFRFLKKKEVKDKYVNKEVKAITNVATFLGCFVSGGEVRDLPVFAGSSPDTSPNNCNDQCRNRHKKFFGLHNGKECWCGDSYGNFGESPDAAVNCYMPCEGNRKEKCGSDAHNSVYSTAFIAPPVPEEAAKE